MDSSVGCPDNIIAAYSNEKYCDLQVVCGTLTFNVHRVVVCSSCDFFEKSVNFAVGKEAEDRCIILPEDDPDMIYRLITYLYVGDYEPCNPANLLKHRRISRQPPTVISSTAPHKNSTTTDHCACFVRTFPTTSTDLVALYRTQVAEPLSIHADMYALGDKYQVKGLCTLAASKFSACLHHHWDSKDFITAVQAVYSSTPDSNRGLRDVVVKAFQKYFDTDVTKDPSIEAKLHKIDGLSFELLKSWPKKVNPLETPNTLPSSPFVS